MRDNRSGRWPFNLNVTAPGRQALVVTGHIGPPPDGYSSNVTNTLSSSRGRCHSGICLRPDSDAVSELTATLWRAANTLSDLMVRRVLSDVSLTWEQWELLRHICEFNATTVDACADRLGLDVVRVFEALTVLNQAGLVHLRSVHRDVRGIVAATERGQKLVPPVQQRIADLESALLCPLRPAHAWAVDAVLKRLESRANAMGDHLCLCRAYA
jgi:DNA-binding MarR family transcriptional regulator